MQIIIVKNAQFIAKIAQAQQYVSLVTQQISYFHNYLMVCVIQVVESVCAQLILSVNLARLQALQASILFLQ